MNLEDVTTDELCMVLMRRLQTQHGINEVSSEVLVNISNACEAEYMNRMSFNLGFLNEEYDYATG